MTIYLQDLRQVEIQCGINQHNDVITAHRATGTGRSAATATGRFRSVQMICGTKVDLF